MAYFGQHVLFTIQGSLPGSEVWNCGLRTGVIGGIPSNANLAAAATTVANAFATVFTTTNNSIGTTVTLDQVTARFINAAGATVDLASNPPAATTIGSGSVTKPNQCAVVVTLLTQSPTRRGRGRIYLPVLAGAMSNGRMAGTQTNSLADTMRTCINTINTAITTSLSAQICVQSQVAPLTAASVNLVTGIRVGDIIDTQRGRRDGMSEAYSLRNIP